MSNTLFASFECVLTQLLDKIITYLKDEGNNSFTLAKFLCYMITYTLLALETCWQLVFVLSIHSTRLVDLLTMINVICLSIDVCCMYLLKGPL